ncbi:hypothetical protein DPMN_107774 [Dreissena polymorpha]|uniref:Uncharacterized protein n=1 Tax=Dreissena polymorpha TaxID=45954 RepID=A0A9D4QK69_DREPO|nr:hypothetical protein DPMN_107774 [Dreissena polymorpha]
MRVQVKRKLYLQTGSEGYFNLSLPSGSKKCRSNTECNNYDEDDDDSDVFVGIDNIELKTLPQRVMEETVTCKRITFSESGKCIRRKKV